MPPGPPSSPGAPTPPGPPKPPGTPKPPGLPQPSGQPVPPAAAGAPEPATFAEGSQEAHLAALDVFGGLTPGMVRAVAAEGQFRAFSSRAEICREGEYTSEFFVLLDGTVGVYKAEAGDRNYLGTLSSGNWFGEMSCMSHAPRNATVLAEGEALVLQLPRHVFMKCYGDRKSTAFKTRIDDAYRERALENHLGSVALFRGLSRRVLREIGRVAELIVAEKGEAVVEQGAPCDAFFLVRTGHARVIRTTGDDEEIVAWLCENSFFGELALLGDTPRGSAVEAVDRMDLVRIPREPFLALLEAHPEVKATVLARVRQLIETENPSPDDAKARERATEIGTEHEVIKAGDALVIDMSKCTHCNMCVTGCIEAHDDRIPRIGKRGIRYGDLLLTSSCYNCKVPDCMLACKFGAIRVIARGRCRSTPTRAPDARCANPLARTARSTCSRYSTRLASPSRPPSRNRPCSRA